jgi:hypothetical protein
VTALTDREFTAELDAITADTTPLGLPATWALGECDTCGDNTQVRIDIDGLVCQDCADAAPVYDPSDEYERPDNGWGWDE